MKKIIVALLVFTMLLAALVPVSAAEATLKKYEDAADGELLYTFNFNGDDVFKPKGQGSAERYFTYTASEDGSTLTVKATEKCPESNGTSYWGAAIDGLAAGKDYTYSFVYKVKANGTTGVNNKLGIGAWFDNKILSQVINSYGSHNAAAPADAEPFDFSTCLEKGSTKYGSYVSWKNVGEYDTDADGFVTFMIVYDGPNQKVTSYMLAKGATDITDGASWLEVETAKMMMNKVPDTIGFGTYSHYAAVDTTVKDAKLYKGYVMALPETTAAPETTKAPKTEAPTTAAPATEAPEQTEAPAAESGCGGTVSLAGLALIAVIGTGAVVTSKKRR